MANIFLTGATGFVGSFVLEKLVAQKHHVTCLIRKSSNLRWIKDQPVDFVVGSLFHPDSFKEALGRTDYIFHIAGVTKAIKKSDFFEGNVKTTELLLDAIRTSGRPIQRFVLVSSQAAVGPSPSAEPIDEFFPAHPLTDYGKSKLEAEKVAKQFMGQIPLTIVRPPAVFGPRDKDVLQFFRSVKKGFSLKIGKTDQLVSLVYVEDLAQGIVQAAFSENSAGNTYFLCDETSYRWSRVTQITADILGKRNFTLAIPYRPALFIGFFIELISKIRRKPVIISRQKMQEILQPYWVLSPNKAQRDFGYATHFPLPMAIEKTLNWYQREGWL